jgi:AraC-like DNA-binding protein
MNPIPHEVFPDGCVSLLFRRNKRLNLEMLLIKGLSLKTFHTEVFSGDIHWGLKISPVACAKVLRFNPKELKTQPVSDRKLVPHFLTGILPEFSGCQTFEEAISIYENRLRKLKITKEAIDEKVAKAVRIIEKEKGEIKVGEIADKLEISRRQLERRFKKCSGITPKQLTRTYRLRATSINLLEKDMNWASRAAEMGFSDQSHLYHELENLTGRTPKSFKEHIQYVNHQDLIK